MSKYSQVSVDHIWVRLSVDGKGKREKKDTCADLYILGCSFGFGWSLKNSQVPEQAAVVDRMF